MEVYYDYPTQHYGAERTSPVVSNNTSLQKNIEKLPQASRSTALETASGLAISEKMRAQIAGLQVAQNNAQDGISLIQTAEGALTEVHSMLNRMVELAEKSANGTIQDALTAKLSRRKSTISQRSTAFRKLQTSTALSFLVEQSEVTMVYQLLQIAGASWSRPHLVIQV